MEPFVTVCAIAFGTLLVAQILNPVDGVFHPRATTAWVLGTIVFAAWCRRDWIGSFGVAFVADYAAYYIGISVIRHQRRIS